MGDGGQGRLPGPQLGTGTPSLPPQQSLQWEGQKVTGQRAWAQHWEEESGRNVKSTTVSIRSGWAETNEIRLLRSDQCGYGCPGHGRHSLTQVGHGGSVTARVEGRGVLSTPPSILALTCHRKDNLHNDSHRGHTILNPFHRVENKGPGSLCALPEAGELRIAEPLTISLSAGE